MKPSETPCLCLTPGYVKPPKDVPRRNLTVPIILGVGITLILLILMVVLARVYIYKKSNKAMNVSRELLLFHCIKPPDFSLERCNDHSVH